MSDREIEELAPLEIFECSSELMRKNKNSAGPSCSPAGRWSPAGSLPIMIINFISLFSSSFFLTIDTHSSVRFENGALSYNFIR
jgi:hypothetical protein